MFRRKALAIALTAAVAGFGAGTAGATALGFEGAPSGEFTSSFVESGYNMAVTSGNLFGDSGGSLGPRELEADFNNGLTDTLTVTRVGGGDFQFDSIDIQLEYGGSANITLEGYLNGILQQTELFSTNSTSYSARLASNLQLVNIDELRITADRNFDVGMAFDNLVLREIDGQAPIPGTLALLGLGLAGLGALRRQAA